MIYTVTLNPSLDYIVTVDDFRLGMTNRTASEHMFPGGKGINVSIVLNNLGMETTALGYVAGFVGDEIVKRVEEFGIKSDFIPLTKGISRINVKLTSIDGTEINGQGPEIPKEKLDTLLERLQSLTKKDVLVLAGSIPSSMSADTYQMILEKIENTGAMVVVDAAKNLLLNVLGYHPFLIKPNHHELGEIFHVSISTWEEAIPYAKKLQERGARNVLVSMGGKGGVLLTESGEVYAAKAYECEAVNTVGAGDSTVAGFITGYRKTGNYRDAFALAMAAGGASAASPDLATQKDVDKVIKSMKVISLVPSFTHRL